MVAPYFILGTKARLYSVLLEPLIVIFGVLRFLPLSVLQFRPPAIREYGRWDK